ncbi:MAG: translation initiation factor IF-2 [Planctomycetes bacterium]|nr:translation initiation factor IF-2 [Planctomycetota bacterium]
MRLHELAKKHGYNQQDLLTAIQEQGFDVKNPLAGVDGEVEKWVAGKAGDGWIPPPPAKNKTVKKKKVLVKPPIAVKSADEAVPEPVPADSPPAPEATVPAVAAAPEPEPVSAVAEPVLAEPGPEPDSVPVPVAAEVKNEPPPPIKRVGTTVKGTAAVGQASPETIAVLKRMAGRISGSPHRDSEDRRTPSKGGKKIISAPASPAEPGRISAKVEPVMPDANLSGKTAPKQRVKAKTRLTQDIEEREGQEKQEKRAKASRRSRSKRDDWSFDDIGDGEYDDQEIAAPFDSSNTGIIESVSRDILTTDVPEDRSAGFKHKRADFKSKRIQHELPASFAEIDNEFTRSIASGGRRRSSRNTQRRVTGRRFRTRRFATPIPRAAGQEAIVHLGMTIRDLSIALGIKLQEILSYMLSQNQMVQVNDIITGENIHLVAEHFNIPLKWESDEDLEEELAQEEQLHEKRSLSANLLERPPVVTFMGHVDHGKTSLLDAIRDTRVVDGEHGGITQHIGAYSVIKNRKHVTFLDTPGHEAFSAMRARGANITDIAVLVVAADDGVMPQTIEAASHAKSAGVPIVIAINKCDLPSANPDKVRQELANRLELLPEEWGGQVGMVEVSAHTRMGLDGLIERILLEAEVLELRADPARPATGFVIEAKRSGSQGVVATLLVSDGTLRVGDVILCSDGYGKIRFMFDEFGRSITEAVPGTPVRMSGLSAVPEAGGKFFILSDLHKARAIAEQRERESRATAMAKRQHVTLENLTSHLAGSGKRELFIVIKADVVGSLEVIGKTLHDLATSEVGINIIHSAVGGVNYADVILADASDAIVLGFNVAVEPQARNAAAGLGVQVRIYHIIYRMIEDMKAALEGLLPPEEKEVVQGHIEIRQVFRSSKLGAIAGCYVSDGQIQRTNRIRLYRNQVVIYDGSIQSLRRVKDDAREVRSGFECGIKIANYDAIEEGDVIEAYSIEEIARKL